MSTVPRPAARAGHALAYDFESDRVILFGGRGPSVGSETWAYDVNTDTWTRMGATGPSARYGTAMVYVPGLDRVILFGGFESSTQNPSNETWAYNYNADAWTRLPASNSPSPRGVPALAYDSASGQVILFGGNTGVLPNDETWSFDPQTLGWTLQSPTLRPSPRERYDLAYVSTLDRILLFGGGTASGPSNETWTYDFDNDTWTMMNPASAPSPRQGHRMVYDTEADRVILFAGDTGARNNETWSYDLGTNAWANLNPALAPTGRMVHRMAYDIESDRVVLFGGEWPFAGVASDETWAYDFGANEWIPMDVQTRPSARAYHAMAYDSESDRIVLFGGSTRGAVSSGETWAYDANTNIWRIRSPSPSPSSRDAHAMAYDAGSDRVILFGGFTATGPNNETWAYDYNMNTWTNMMPTVGPSRRYATRMVYDSLADRIILFGGEDGVGFLGDTWSYDYNSNTWTRLTTVGTPPARGFYAMGHDAESDLVIVFGGNGASIRGDTWTFQTGTATWTQVTPATSPSPRGWCSGTYDARLDRFIFFGGDTGPTETWAFDANANSWSRVDASPSPSERHEHAIAYDGESNHVVLFGGAWPVLSVTAPNMVRNRETWLFDGGNRTWTMVDGPEPPVASFTFSPASPTAGDPIAFDSAASSDPDGTIVLYDWDFGDSASAVGPTVQHVFANPGTYNVRLTVTDNDGLSETAAEQVLVVPETVPPSIAITSPPNDAILNSTSVTITGTASDNRAVGKVELSTDGTNWFPAIGTTSWSGVLEVSEGSRTIHARATDSSGNQGAATISITVDVTSPIVGISSPESLPLCTATTVTVMGTATDNVGVERVELSTDGANWALAEGTTAWSGTLTLGGSTTVYARATDLAGNAAGQIEHQDCPSPIPLAIVAVSAGIAAVAAAGVIAAILIRRRRKRGQDSALTEDRAVSSARGRLAHSRTHSP